MSLRTIHPTLGQHIQCLAKKGYLMYDVTHMGDPDSFLLSPCCEHGYRAVWSPRPKLDFIRAAEGLNRDTLSLRRELQERLEAAQTEQERIDIQAQLDLQRERGEYNTARDRYTWTDASDLDQPGFFTERQVNELDGSWVFVAAPESFDDLGFPVDSAAKWFVTTQGDASTLAEELIVNTGDEYLGVNQTGAYRPNTGSRGGRKSGSYLGDRSVGASSTFRRFTTARQVRNISIPNSGSVLGEASQLPDVGAGGENRRGYNGFQRNELFWVLYGERTFEGITRCQDAEGENAVHIHHGSGDNWGGLQNLLDPEIQNLISPTETAQGGYHPNFALYGGDIIGASGKPVLDASGNITDFIIDDPGSTVITHSRSNSIEPPSVAIDMPDHYSAFEATAQVSTDPVEIKNLLGDTLFKNRDAMIAEVCDGYNDPIAQTFMISSDAHPDGVFVPKIDLCFQQKPVFGSRLPVFIEIRPTVNGHPHAEKIITSKRLYPRDVKVASGRATDGSSIQTYDNPIFGPSDGVARSNFFPSFTDENSFTSVTFDSPVYLSPGEYAIVVRSNDSTYRCWIADINERAVNSNDSLGGYGATDYPDIQTTSNIQQYGGVFFRSSNGRTWEPNQNQDLMFRIHKCNFKGTSASSPSVSSPRTGTVSIGGSRVSSDFDYHRLDLKTDSIFNPNPSATSISGTLKTKVNGESTISELTGSSGNLVGERADAKVRDLPDVMNYRTGRMPSSSDIQLDYTLSTTNKDVSPIIDTRNIFAIPYQNDIDAGELKIADIKIVNGGGNYAVGTERFTISGGGSSSSAVVEAASVDGNGVITSLRFVSGSRGQNFHKFQDADGKNRITITEDSNGGSGGGAILEVRSEEGADAGNSRMRYITKNIDLAPGMEARAIKVFLTAKEPMGSNLYVYYKVRSREDSEDIKFKKWRLMERTSPDQDYFTPSVSPIAGSQGDSVVEYVFDTEPIISYQDSDNNTHDSFATFSIKIVGQASNKARVPVVNNMRAVAVF